MGEIYTVGCVNCEYEQDFEIGTSSLNLMYSIQNGGFGLDVKQLFELYPNGMFDSDLEVYQCRKCLHIETKPNLSLYILDHSINRNPNTNTYHLYRRYVHLCPTCHERMIRILGKPKDTIIKNQKLILKKGLCPICQSQLVTKCVIKK